MNKLTTIILTKNEEDMIADCIDSVSFSNEIIVVDSQSTDKTSDIAKRMGAKVIETKTNSFAERRNAGLKAAKYEWVFYIDADERVSKSLQENIKWVLQEESIEDIGGYKVHRLNYYLGNNPWPMIESMERLFYKKNISGWKGELHETPIVSGSIKDIDGMLLHYTHRSLTKMLAKTIEWSQTEAKLRFDAKHPEMTLWRFPRVMIPVFFDYYIRQKGWKLGKVGLIESMYQSFSIFITYARLWEMQKQHANESNV